MIGILAPFKFNVHGSDCATKWQKWLRGYEVFAKANKIIEDEEKCNWLLHYAGENVQDVYFSLPEVKDGEEQSEPTVGRYVLRRKSEYELMVGRLNDFFDPKQNPTYERHVFRKMKQEKHETFEMFLIRLRTQAERCDFQDQFDSHVKDQLTEKCSSTLLRRKILERGEDTLEQIVKMARSIEAATRQQEAITDKEENKSGSEEVCKIEPNKDRRFKTNRFHRNTNQTIECHRCGFKGHKAMDSKCPAKGKTCAKCGGRDHFAKKCYTQEEKRGQQFRPSGQTPKTEKSDDSEPDAKKKRSNEKVQQVDEQGIDQVEEYDDVFAINDEGNEIGCKIGGIFTDAVIDSGSKHNIIGQSVWQELKGKGVQTFQRTKQVDKKFKAYGGQELIVCGKFTTQIEIRDRKEVADFFVIQNGTKFLLGRDTATKLKVLKIGYDVNTVSSAGNFNVIKDVIVEIPLKEGVKPVIQPYRRVPAPLQKAVDNKIKEMLDTGIIERVNGSSKWISPLVVVPKGDDIRICVDMRRANQAVDRENHPLPTIDDFMTELQDAVVFSRLDVKNAFHQIID